ncbi:hypothetical protein N8567_01565 [Akkermansiaceae bacterium]|nr:hypothetical protein [Akkermansiaceae bacterium]MDA7654773.1 hypothetical protein [Akkermansiaceae bacterium]MDB4707880.1 hypothetical protein [Akkermansiaceae bacterium]MDB4801320.1 hypothetical protein [Akkermansiaceae bacterium]
MNTLHLKLYSSLVGVGLLFTGISSADLVIYYPFNTEAGTTVANNGNQEDGTLVGGATYGVSKDATFGQAFYGNRTGANDGYVQTGLTGTDLGMGPDSVYTAMAWVNWTGVSGQVDHMVFGQEDGPGNNSMLHHGIRADSDANAHYGGWGNDLNDAGTIVPGEWTHVAWQFDGADKVVYVNGVETGRGAGSTMAGHALPVIVGGHGRDAADPAGQSFNGALDEVKVWDEVLTLAQIQAAMSPSADSGDSDEDGLSDIDEETTHLTDPNNPDTDGDGLTDGEEVKNGLDPKDATGNNGADGDFDSDGLSNIDEIKKYFTDPKSDDSDGDGLSDRVETGTGTFVNLNDTGTDPLNADTDNDALNDSDELAAGTDPFNPDTDGDTVPDGVDDDPLSSGGGFEFGLVSYWPLDSDLLDTFDDNHGTEDGGVIPFETGKFGNAINLDGTQNVIITGGDESEFDFTGGSMTVSVWCTAATINTGWQCLIAKGEENGWRIHRRSNDIPEEFSWTGGAGDTPAHGTAITIGGEQETWHHLVGVTEGVSGVESLYIDGVEVATKSGAALGDRTNRMRIGENPDALGRGWNGKVDDVAIWARALSPDEIAEIWAAGEGTSIEVLLGGGTQFAITDITYNNKGTDDRSDDTISLTWPSKEGQSYGIFYSEDLFNWDTDLNDNYPADEGDSTTYTFPVSLIGDPGPGRGFFRIQK